MDVDLDSEAEQSASRRERPLVLGFYGLAVLLAGAHGWWNDEQWKPALLLFGFMEAVTAVACALTAVGWGDEWKHNWLYFLRWTVLNAVVVSVIPAVAWLRG